MTVEETEPETGNIVVVKQTDPDGDPTEFDFTTSYTDPFSLSDGESNDSGPLAPGPFSVTESPEPGWTLTSATCDDGSPVTAIDLDAGETVTCTFLNEQEQQPGTIVVVKETDPDGDPQSFEFTTDYTEDFSLSDGQSNDTSELTPGTYSVSETVPDGWEQTSATCNDGSDPSEIGLDSGETVTCTFTNTKLVQTGTIVVEKQTRSRRRPDALRIHDELWPQLLAVGWPDEHRRTRAGDVLRLRDRAGGLAPGRGHV